MFSMKQSPVAEIKQSSLFSSNEDSKSMRNCIYSILLDSSFWSIGEANNSSIEVTSAGEHSYLRDLVWWLLIGEKPKVQK